MWFFYVCLLIAVLAAVGIVILYRKSTYFQNTHRNLLSVLGDKGFYGEFLTYLRLRKQEKNGARFLFNAYLPRKDGETTEADVILLNESGIFVFESKNYSGWIFGSEKSKTWTQCLAQGKNRPARKEHFLNPIMQNKLHISAIKQIVGDRVPFFSMVVFSRRCTLKNVTVSDPLVTVINRYRAASAVEGIVTSTGRRLTQEQIDGYYELLLPYTQVSEEVRKQHIAAINKRLSEASVSEAAAQDKDRQSTAETAGGNAEGDAVCPKCGGKLVLRTAKRGPNEGSQFWGCSNYPTCRYTKMK